MVVLSRSAAQTEEIGASQLGRYKLWKVVQEKPSEMRFPNGESFIEVQARAVAEKLGVTVIDLHAVDGLGRLLRRRLVSRAALVHHHSQSCQQRPCSAAQRMPSAMSLSFPRWARTPSTRTGWMRHDQSVPAMPTEGRADAYTRRDEQKRGQGIDCPDSPAEGDLFDFLDRPSGLSRWHSRDRPVPVARR